MKPRINPKPFEDYIPIFLAKHGNFYDYSLSKKDYKNSHSKISIICPNHGEYKQRLLSHTKYGCRKCQDDKRRATFSHYLKRFDQAHGQRYDYSESEQCLENVSSAIKIICLTHGPFFQRIDTHMAGHGCPRCAWPRDSMVKPLSHFLEKIKEKHGDFYDYSFIHETFKNSRSYVKIICPKHNGFIQKIQAHAQGQGCPRCNKSKGEMKIACFLQKHRINFIEQQAFPGLIGVGQKLLKFDFYLPDYNLCIEYDGEQHFRPVNFFGGMTAFETQLIHDELKNVFCLNAGIGIIRVSDLNEIEEILTRQITQRDGRLSNG